MYGDDYILVAVISLIAIIFETTMHKHPTVFKAKYYLISSRQNGFQGGKSTTSAAVDLIKKIIESINEKIPVTVFFCFI